MYGKNTVQMIGNGVNVGLLITGYTVIFIASKTLPCLFNGTKKISKPKEFLMIDVLATLRLYVIVFSNN